MTIHSFLDNYYSCNAYLVEEKGRSILIDAPTSSLGIIDRINSLNLTLEAIYLTHSHFDHTFGLEDIAKAFPKVKIYIGSDEYSLFKDNGKNIKDLYSRFYGKIPNINIPLPTNKLSDGDKLLFGINAIASPGHTSGGFSFYLEEENIIFTGDTLFRESVGRTDLGGHEKTLLKSVNKILSLPSNTIVYPGHSESTTISHEIENNPFI